jgi:hypothetical protein
LAQELNATELLDAADPKTLFRTQTGYGKSIDAASLDKSIAERCNIKVLPAVGCMQRAAEREPMPDANQMSYRVPYTAESSLANGYYIFEHRSAE